MIRCPYCHCAFSPQTKLSAKTRIKIRVLVDVLSSGEFDITRRGGLDAVMDEASETLGEFYSTMQVARVWLIDNGILFHPNNDRFEWRLNSARIGLLEQLLAVSPRYDE